MKYSVFSGVLPELSAEAVCATLARHGYDGVEWRVDGEYHFKERDIDRDAGAIRELCARHGLEVTGLTTYVRPDQEDALRRLIDAARALDCPRFRIFSAAYDRDMGYTALHRDTLAKLERVQGMLDGTGVKALIEIHFGTIVASPFAAFELLRHLDPARIGVIFDPANMVIEGGLDLDLALDVVGPWVDLVHVKNVRWERHDDGRWRWRWDELADGQLDWGEAVAALRRAGYDGWMSFETLHRVPVMHRGYIAEDVSTPGLAPRDIDTRLPQELAYVRGLVEGA